MFKLTILDDEGKNTVVPLPSGRDEFTIGRKDGNTIRLTERNVSRSHARLVRSNGSFYIEDKSSYTGVKVNGDRITGRRHIKEGDEIKIGDYHLSLAVEKNIEKETKSAKPSNGSVGSGTAVINLSKAQQEKLRAGEKDKVPSADKGRLCLLSGPLAGKMFGIEREEVVIGRTDDNDIVLNHRSISRNHAKIIVTGNVHQIVDLGSANGVRVNGEEYGKIDLRKGDKIDLGHVRLRFVGPGEDFNFDMTMKEDVVGGDDGPSEGGRAGLWVAIVAGLAVIGGVGAYAMGYFTPTQPKVPDPNKDNVTVVAPDPKTAPTLPNTNTPPANNAEALLVKAEEAAKKKDWQGAQKFAEEAGNKEKADLYFAEGNASEFLTLCQDAVTKNNTDDIFTYCFEAMKESTNTNTYKDSQTLINEGKGKYKEKALAEVKALLDKAEAGSKTTDAKALGNAKSQVTSAKSKLDNISKFSGSDGDVATLDAKANTLAAKLKDIKAECDEATCSAQGKTCNVAKGVCEAKPIECTEDCAAGGGTCDTRNGKCKGMRKECSPECSNGSTCDTKTGTCRGGSAVNPTATCDTSKCPNGCEADNKTCLAGATAKSKDEMVEEIKSALTQPDGCASINPMIETLKKTYGYSADYYFYKAYCLRDSNPDKACTNYLSFLKSAKADGRVSQAKSYIQSQDPTAYPTCVLP